VECTLELAFRWNAYWNAGTELQQELTGTDSGEFFFSFVELIITYGQISHTSHHTALSSPSRQPNPTHHHTMARRGQEQEQEGKEGSRGYSVPGTPYIFIFLKF